MPRMKTNLSTAPRADAPDAELAGRVALGDTAAFETEVQERLTEQVADALVQALEPKGVVVIAQARHLCMAMRGVQKQSAVTLTRALRGAHEEIVPLVKGASSRQFSEVESQALHERFARRRPRDRAGIVVNDYLRSADPAIYAVGDVAEVGGWLYPRATLQPRFPGRRRYSPWPSRCGFAVQRQAVAVRV